MKATVILEMANNHMGSVAHAKKIIKILTKNLSKANSPFAELTKILENRAHTAELT